MKILLAGACGKAGGSLAEALRDDENVEAYYVDRKLPLDKDEKTFPSYGAVGEKVDAVIDFSSHSLTFEALGYCLKTKAAFLAACTGHDAREIEAIYSAASEIPVAVIPNCAIGALALKKALAAVLDVLCESDIEMTETHSSLKKDSPSGTAKALFEEIEKHRLGAYCVTSRNGVRRSGEVGIFSLRGAGAVGEHEIRFFKSGETVVLKHTVFDRSAYAAGAIKAAKSLAVKSPGIYTVEELI